MLPGSRVAHGLAARGRAALAALLVSLAIVGVPAQASGQSTSRAALPGPAPSLPLADALIRSAFTATDRGDFTFAERLLSHLDSGAATADPWIRGQVMRCRGLIALSAGRYAEAATAAADAERAFEQVGAIPQAAMTWRLRARVALQQGDRTLSRDLSWAALAVFEARGDVAEAVATLSVLATALERHEGAYDVLMRALHLAERAGLGGPRARLLQTLGDQHFAAGEFAQASRAYQRAEATHAALGDQEGLGRVWTSLGRLYRAHGRHEVALAYYRRALSALERAGDQQGVIQAVNAIATALGNLGRDEEAGAEYERALVLAERSGSARIVNFQRGNLGGHYLARNDLARAIPLLRESAAQESNQTNRAIRLVQLGIALARDGRPAEALAPLDRAIAELRQLENRERLFGALAERAGALRALGRTEQALADVRASLGTLEEVRRQLAPGDFLRRGFHQYTRDNAALGIRILMEAGRAREAVDAAEQARARAFLDLLAARPALVPPDGGERPAPAAAAGDIDPGSDPLLLRTDRGAAPDRAAESTRAFSFDEVVAESRARNSTLLKYWVDTTRTHIWVVRPDGQLRHATVEVESQRLVELIQAFWQGLSDGLPKDLAAGGFASRRSPPLPPAASPSPAAAGKNPAPLAPMPTPRGAARELYRLLVAPVAAALPADGTALTIVPHGPLFRLSFAGLLDDRDRYLVERFATSYGPSVSVLAFTRATAARRTAGLADRYLLVADPAPLPPHTGEPLAPLPGTLEEIAGIRPLIGAEVTTLTGDAATELAVTHAFATATVVHLATHGIVRDDDPLGSFLALAAAAATPEADGALTAEEIYRLPMHARLVVLSACRSGLGEVTADGIVGLTRAFFFAGAPSVVATLWDVADAPTARMLRDFYAALPRAGNLAAALRDAQLKMLADLRAGRIRAGGASGARLPERPAFWAGFVLAGEP